MLSFNFSISIIAILFERVEDETSEIFIPMIILSSILLAATCLLIHYYFANNRIDEKYDTKMIHIFGIPTGFCLFATLIISCRSNKDFDVTPSILR
jgi:hypothetical protein